jgi:hypothetical protein
MFFKSAFVFAIVSAISACLLALLCGMVGFGIYWGLVKFAVVPAISQINVLVLLFFGLAIFLVSVPVEFVYARRTLFGPAPSSMRPAFLLLPAAMAVVICSRVFDWLDPKRQRDTQLKDACDS